MKTTSDQITLQDYCEARENVVIFFAGFGQPTGDYTLAGHPEFDFADRRGLLDLTGAVDSEGAWQWDGDGEPTDDRGNSITKIQAFSDAEQWTAIVQEYDSAV
jgi:hypothetical protein